MILSIIVPCYNESCVLPETAKRLAFKIEQLKTKNMISQGSNIIFVDDGSTDNTWELISKYHDENPSLFCGIKLSKNRGHQNALLCGLLTMKDYCDVAISIDADLQDDIEIFDKMLERHISGFEIVYAVRSKRETDNFFKRATAQYFYSFMRLLGADIIYNHADFRLMGKQALNALSQYKEVNLFLRGIIPMLGFKCCIEYYERAKRFAGTSKYPVKKMLAFSFQGITSLSIKPIRMITFLGLIIFCMSIVMSVYFIHRHYEGHTIVGWSSMIVSLWAIGGLILFSIGIVGEYIGKIYLETKQRPRYHIEQFLHRGQQ
ncbi:MAG: glycosyltransferase [Termitinemataceae bacterium]|nr:MAG: glycosyltransferase [Termitinemataceae bacterium]